MSLADLDAESESFVEKGECVVVIDRAAAGAGLADDDEVTRRLEVALGAASLKDAVREVCLATGRPRREVYQIGLSLRGGDGGEGQ